MGSQESGVETAPAGVDAAFVEAARDLIAAGGLKAVSMRAVAERVGVSATAIYHHFANKQALIDAVVHRAFERFGEVLERAVREQPKGSLERVAALGEAYVRFSIEHQAYFRVIFSIAAPDPREVEELPHGAGYPLLRQSIVDAMAAGHMRDADPDLMAHYLWAHVHGIVTLVLSCRLDQCPECQGRDEPIALELLRAFAPLLRHGIAADAGEGAA